MLRARLLGALEVELDGTGIQSSVSQRPWALFAYLALAGKPVSRAELVARFWPDVLDQSARASLRSALWTLRRQLGGAVAVEGDVVELSHEEGTWIDVLQFELLARSDPEHALELCRGELLEGFEDEWALAARDRHRERVVELLEHLARRAEQRGEKAEAISLTRRQTDCDPLDEAAHRRLMQRLDAAGDRAAAIRAYKGLAERLRRELAVAPAPQTRELADHLREPEASAQETRTVRQSKPATPLIGRASELSTLELAWQQALAGSGSVALVRGEAGIGKTRLTEELRRRAAESGALTATSAALDLGGQAPFSLWAELLGELLPTLPPPPLDATWLDDLTLLVSHMPAHFARSETRQTTVAPDLQRTRLFEAVVALLRWATGAAPVLLALEDVHSADAPSLELAAYAARRAGGLRVMIVATRRPLPPSPDADRFEQAVRARESVGAEIELSPLGADPIAALVRQSAQLSDADVARVVDRADGNPLLAVETARALARGQEEIAASLRGAVRATLAQAPEDARRLIELAAVAAREVDPQMIRLLPTGDPEEAASSALQTGLLRSTDGALAFRHALLRDAVYEEIAEPRRRGLHQRWAHLLLAVEQQGGAARPAEVARQLRLAHADRDAVPQLERAAAQARSLAALEQAVEFLQEALGIDGGRAEPWLELGEIEAWRGRREQSDAAFERGLELLSGGDPLTVARAHLQRARANHGPICVPQVVRQSSTAALTLLDDHGIEAERERSEALAEAAWTEAVAGSPDEAERLLRELSTGTDVPNDLRIYDVGHARALTLMRRGHFTESFGPSIAAGEAVARAGRPDLAYGCWSNAASAAVAAGEYERALEFLDRATEAIAGTGLRRIEVNLLGERAFVLRSVGRHAQAREVASAEQSLADALGQPELVAMANHDRGMVELEAGAYEQAASLLAASLIEGAPISRPLTRLALAEALARSGNWDAAAEQVRATVLEPVGPSDFPDALVPRLARVQGLIALAQDDHEQAVRRLQEAVGGWERLVDRTLRAESITTVLADLGRPVVGLIEPERELARAREDLEQAQRGAADAVVQ